MGANDVCDMCGDALDFWEYYIFNVQKKNGLDTVNQMTERYCADCVGALGLDRTEKWVNS